MGPTSPFWHEARWGSGRPPARWKPPGAERWPFRSTSLILPPSTRRLLASKEELGPIDIWVNNAFAGIFAEFLDVSPEEYRRVTDVTYLGQVWGTRAALRHMLPRDRGSIVLVGSALAYRGIPLQSAYCGAKHATQGFLDSVRTELLARGSRVNLTMVQLPGVNTPQFDWVRAKTPGRPRADGSDLPAGGGGPRDPFRGAERAQGNLCGVARL